MNLAQKHCQACEGDVPPFTVQQAQELLPHAPGWELQNKVAAKGTTPMLARLFKFKDFVGAMAFVNRVADLAEAEGHHPDIHISWNRVRLELTTHSIKGLSENDFIMAAKINEMERET